MEKFVCLLVCLTLAGYAFGLECHQCTLGQDCFNVANTNVIACGKTLVMKGHESRCFKKVLEDSQTQKRNITRTCVLMDPRNPDELCKHNDPKSKQIECFVCNEDKCNDSPKIGTNLSALCGATLAAFLTKYFLY